MLAVSGQDDQKLTIWDLSSGKQIGNVSNLVKDAKAITAIAFDNAASRLLVGDSKGRLYGWKMSSGLQLAEPFSFENVHSKPIKLLKFSPDNQQFVSSAGQDGLCLCWRWKSKSVFQAYQHETSITDIAFSNSDRLVASSIIGEVVEINFGRTIKISDFKSEPHYADFLSTVPENDQGVAIDNPIDFSDWPTYVKSPAILTKIKTACRANVFKAHESKINAIDVSGNQLLTVGEDQQVLVWDFAKTELSKQLRGHNDDVVSAQFTETGKVLSVGVNGQTRYWDLVAYEDERFVFPTPNGDQNQPNFAKTVRTNRDGTKVVVADASGRVFIRENSQNGATVELSFNDSLGVDATYLPKSNRIVTSSVNLLKIWDAGSQYFETKKIGKAGLFTVSKSERFLVTAGDEIHPTVLWDITKRQKISEIFPTSDGRHRVTAMAISPDDHFLAIGTGLVEGLLFIYDLNSKEIVGTYERHRGWISDIVFTDSNTLFSADALEGYVNVWAVDSKAAKFKVRIDEGLGSYIKIAATDSGNQIVTSSIRTETSDDGKVQSPKSTLKVWDANSLEFLDQTDLKSLLRFLDVHVGNRVVVQETDGSTKRLTLHENGTFKNVSAIKSSNSVNRPRRLNGWKSYENSDLVFADGYVALIKNGKATQSVGNMSACTDAYFVNGDKQILAIYELGLIRLWDLESATIKQVVQSQSSKSFQKLTLCDDGSKFAAYDGETTTIFSTTDLKIQTSIATSGLVAFDWLDNESLVYAEGESMIQLTVKNGEKSPLFDVGSPMTAFDFTPDASAFVCINELDDRSEFFVFKKSDDAWKNMGSQSGDFSAIAITNNGKRVFSGSKSGTLTVWDCSKNGGVESEIRPLLSSTKHTQGISSLHLNKQFEQLTTASENGEVIVWLATE